MQRSQVHEAGAQQAPELAVADRAAVVAQGRLETGGLEGRAQGQQRDRADGDSRLAAHADDAVGGE